MSNWDEDVCDVRFCCLPGCLGFDSAFQDDSETGRRTGNECANPINETTAFALKCAIAVSDLWCGGAAEE